MKVRCALYVEVTEEKDLEQIDFEVLPKPLLVLGGGSNLLFTGDFPGTVLHLAIRFLHPFGARNDNSVGVRNDSSAGVRNDNSAGVRNNNSVGVWNDTAAPSVIPSGLSVIPSEAKESLVTVGAGVVFDDFCAWAAAEGLWGPENLSLIPGDVGASAVQNIGAYGVEAKDIIASVRAYDLKERRFVEIPTEECRYGYRDSRFKGEWKGRFFITAVTYRLSRTPQPKLDYGGVRKVLTERFLHPFGVRNDSSAGVRNDSSVGVRNDSSVGVRNDSSAGVRNDTADPSVIPSGPSVIPSEAKESLTPQIIRKTIIGIRQAKLPDPKETGSAGSFFKNPVVSREHYDRIVAIARADRGSDAEVPHFDVGDRVKVPAAWMIDQCGFKGQRLGGAQVYPGQPLVIVNATGSATPDEVIALEERIIRAVADKYGVTLHPEVEHVPASREMETAESK